MTATQLLVVPKSIPIIFPIVFKVLISDFLHCPGVQSLCHRIIEDQFCQKGDRLAGDRKTMSHPTGNLDLFVSLKRVAAGLGYGLKISMCPYGMAAKRS
jgi:hypothetical protein